MSIAERPIPDGRLEPVPEFLREATDEERLRWLVAQQKAKRGAGSELQGPVSASEPPPMPPTAPPAASAPDDDLFSESDLFAAPPAVWHTMPNGKKVAVHAVSAAEGVRITAASRKYYRDKVLPIATEEEREVYADLVPMLWQVVLCCRKGLDPTSPRVFKDDKVDALLRNHGWLETIKAIVIKSNAAGGEERILKDVIRGFFAATETYLRTLRSELSEASPPSSESLKSLEDFASFVSRMRSVENLTDVDLEAVRALR